MREWRPVSPGDGGCRMSRWKQTPIWLLFFGTVILALSAFVSSIGDIGSPFPGFLIGKGRNVYPISGPDWAFHTTNLKARDRILAVGKTTVNSSRAFHRVLRKVISGSRVEFTASRGGKKFSFAAPVRKFTVGDWFLGFGIFFIIGLCFLITGFTVFYLKSRLPAAGVFAFFSCAMGISFITLYDAYSGLHFVFFLDICLNLVPPLMVHLACLFPVSLRFTRKNRYIIPSVYFLFLLIWQVKSFLEVSHYTIWTVMDHAGDLLTLTAYLFFIAVLIMRSFREPSPLLRKRAQIALVGMGLAFSLPSFALMTGLSNGSLPLNFSFLTCLFFPLYLGYAIIRHNFFNAEKMIVNTVFYLLYTSFLIFLFLALSAFIGLFFRTGSAEGLLPASLFAVTVLLLSRAQLYLRSLIDRLFFRLKMERSNLFFETSRFIRSVRRLSDDAIPLIEKFFKRIGVNRAAVLLKRSGNFHSFCSFAFQNSGSVRSSRDTIDYLERHAEILTPYDLKEAPVPLSVRDNLERLFDKFPSMLMMPIMLDKRLLGCLMVGGRPDGRAFREADLEILLSFSNQLAVACENSKLVEQASRQERVERELKIASDIQRHFLPETVAENDWYAAAFHYEPARKVGGDIYDFFQDSTDSLGVITGDVSGKGIPAALFGAVSSGIIKAGWDGNAGPGLFMKNVNRQLCRIRSGSLNIVLSCALFDFKKRTLILTNHGLPFPIRVRKKAVFLDSGGLPLAMKTDIRFKEKKIRFRKGDLYLFYSDGLLECRNPKGEMFGFDRLLRTSEETADMDPEGARDFILRRITDFTEEAAPEDDRILQIIRILR